MLDDFLICGAAVASGKAFVKRVTWVAESEEEGSVIDTAPELEAWEARARATEATVPFVVYCKIAVKVGAKKCTHTP